MACYCGVVGLISFIFGLIALIRGEFSLTRSRVVRSGPARIIGALLLLPLLLGTVGAFALGAVYGCMRGPSWHSNTNRWTNSKRKS
jgi:hypothetical protein